MTLREFVTKYDGKQINNGQCVLLYRAYISEVWGLEPLEGLGEDGGAEGLVRRYGSDVGPKSRKYLELFSRKDQPLAARPAPGDAVVFGPTATNKYGHVGIMVGTGGQDIIIFEQNGIAAMKGEPVRAHLGLWSMDRVIGWLRKKA